MRPHNPHVRRNFRTALVCLTASILLTAPSILDGKTPKPTEDTFQVALQPFNMEPPVARAVAAPAIHETPRILKAVPVTPIRVAYYVPRAVTAPAPRPQSTDDRDDDDDDHDFDQESDQQDQEELDPQIESRGSRPVVEGKRAILRNGIAYAPSRAPQSVKNAIWAANSLRRKPYVWGGGHESFYDRGYDCSGSVSFALHYAGVLALRFLQAISCATANEDAVVGSRSTRETVIPLSLSPVSGSTHLSWGDAAETSVRVGTPRDAAPAASSPGTPLGCKTGLLAQFSESKTPRNRISLQKRSIPMSTTTVRPFAAVKTIDLFRARLCRLPRCRNQRQRPYHDGNTYS